jgi:hypothetical protein
MDFDDDVLYCYEIQLERDLMRQGLGRFMMKVLELLMIKAELKKIMLTVFKHNQVSTVSIVPATVYSIRVRFMRIRI